jgi:hypothetical protein
MSISRKVIFGVLASAMLVTSVAPAMARGGWYGGSGLGWGGGRHHRDNDTGEVLAGVLIGAAVVGILASASKNKRARDTGQNGRDYPNDRRDDRARGNINSENAAVDACAQAAEDRSGNAGSVRDITNVSQSSDGWNVEGVVERRDGWRDRTTERHKFTCSVRYGMVDSVYVEDAKVAYAP